MDTDRKDIKVRGIELAGWLVGFAWLTIIIPAGIIIFLPADDRTAAAVTLATTPFLEYLAVLVGIGLGLNPVVSFLITILPCIGLAMLMIGILGFLKDSSKRATRYLQKVQDRIEKYPRLKKYGVASNFVFIMFLGVYIAPGISIILGWSREGSVLMMAAGISIITLVIGLATLGIVEIFA
jgi:uncharacterized membrane protein